MTEPARPAADYAPTETPGAAPLDPTMVRPEGSAALLLPRREFDFGPPEVDGDLGKLGRYRVLKKLGAGGMGAVYLGADTVLARRVALKVMLPQVATDPEAKSRFLREARDAATVRSDHVVTIFDVGEDRGVPFIAMEYLAGYPLDRFLREQGHPSLANVVRIGRETAQGLAAAHKLGLIHRDIKPGNVWLEAPKGRVKILDFGLARAADADDTELTAPGQVVGTPAYMSPEQARNQKLDPRSDLFSLGVMLYRLATGRLPFEGKTTMEVLTALAVDAPAPPRQLKPTVPPGLEAVILKLMAKRPDDRYASAREAAEALAELERVRAAEPTPADHASMAIPAQFEVVDEPADDSGSRARLLTERVEPAAEGKSVKPARRKAARTAARPAWVVPAAAGAACAAVAGLALLLWPAKGAVVVESDDPDAELVIKRDGAVVRDRTRDRELRLRTGTYTAELADPRPGLVLAPRQFEVTKREPARVRVAAAPGPVPPPPPDDRAAAEWVLSVGGGLRVSGVVADVRAREQLPQRPFQVTRANLSGGQVTDAGLAHLKGCVGLTGLDIRNSPVTESGLAHLRGCRNLTVLTLGFCPLVTDAGLAHFKDCKRLEQLNLFGCGRVTDAGLAHFAGCAALTQLNLGYDGRVTDAGLAAFAGCPNLTQLNLHGCGRVTDAGLAHFKGCARLESLKAEDCGRVTDAGLAHFAGCGRLGELYFDGTGVTDAGLLALTGCPGLRAVEVRRTRVTPAGLIPFSWQVPRAKIVHDGGVLEVDPDRRAAQYALAVNGRVTVRAGGREQELVGPAAAAALPPGPFELTVFNVSRQARPTDAGLVVLTGCRNVRDLFVNESPLTDAGFAHFAGLTSVTRVNAYRTRVGDRGLAALKDCKDLDYLDLHETAVTGVAALKGCLKLEVLDLADCPAVTDAGLEPVQGFAALRHLNLNGSKGVTAAGLARAQELKKLVRVSLHQTQLTAAEAAAFHRRSPWCKVEHDSGVLDPQN